MILLQEGQPLPGSNGHIPLGGLQLTGENFQKGGLSRAVGADEPVAVSLGKFNIHILKKSLLAYPQSHIVR